MDLERPPPSKPAKGSCSCCSTWESILSACCRAPAAPSAAAPSPPAAAPSAAAPSAPAAGAAGPAAGAAGPAAGPAGTSVVNILVAC